MPRNPGAALRAVDIADQAAEHFNNPETAGKLFIPAREGLARANTVTFLYDSLEEAFPKVDPGERPAGNQVLFQLRAPKARSAGGIIIDTETRRTELDNNQVAKVIAIGPIAFHNRGTGEPWPEGAWANVGDYARIPKYQGDRFIRHYMRPDFEVKDGKRIATETRDEVHFVFMKDLAIISIISDPLSVRAYL